MVSAQQSTPEPPISHRGTASHCDEVSRAAWYPIATWYPMPHAQAEPNVAIAGTLASGHGTTDFEGRGGEGRGGEGSGASGTEVGERSE